MAKKDLSPLQGAYYEGGKKAMDEHVQKHLRYPEAALAKKIEGSVHLFLDINNKGEVTNVKVVSGIGSGCDEEATRVVKLMKFHVEKVRNMHVLYHQKIQIHFKLPKQSIAPAPTMPVPDATSAVSYNYVITPAKPKVVKKVEKEAKPKVIYSYNI